MKHIDYNKNIYGNAQFTPAEVIEKLTAEKCFGPSGKLMIWPSWFKAAEMFDTINAGLLKSKSGGRGTYGHSDLMKVA